MTGHLSVEERQLLLGVARAAVEGVFAGRCEDLPSASGRLLEQGASFVTLSREGELRGCVGSVSPHRPLVVDVHHNALGAAFRDPRFSPVTAGEWPQVEVEVSVLHQPRPLRHAGRVDLVRRLGRGSGVILEHPLGRATLLPHVWASLPDPEEFLHVLAAKAGLAVDVYDDPACDIAVYEVEAFSERDLAPPS